MGFLRRLFGGGPPSAEPVADGGVAPPDPAQVDATEAAYELEVLRDEQERLSELARRQMRYADYAWTPPSQGGAKRADDEDRGADAAPPDAESEPTD